MLDNRSYYDTFAARYERGRERGYHRLVDDLQVELVAPSCIGRDVLEVGCGTGRLLGRIAPLARSAVGLDLSTGMLEAAVARGLCCVHGDATALPFADASFDTVYSFKVLAHVREIERALSEVSRVLRPGGRAFLEFYNRHSLRFLSRRARGHRAVGQDTHEGQVFTRWDRPRDCALYLPPGLRAVERHGVRIVTPAAFFHRVPGVAWLLRRGEWFWRDRRPLRYFGGFYVLECERTPCAAHYSAS